MGNGGNGGEGCGRPRGARVGKGAGQGGSGVLTSKWAPRFHVEYLT